MVVVVVMGRTDHNHWLCVSRRNRDRAEADNSNSGAKGNR